jgi:cation diffusion facilitator CzcD-associated flavoprotein CzcO
VSVDEIEKGWAHSGRQPRIAIIGAGFSGIASIIKLREAGYTDLTCFERADRLGGTWRDNTYPGLSCDVPSHWYSYSFEMNPDWTHRFSYGPEIWAYQEKVAQKYQVKDVIQFSNGVIDLTFLGPQWQIRSEKGGDENFDFVIAATGVLVNPSYPDIPGLESFSGAKFHSARWDHSVDLTGKRVGIIGTGSTASQIVGAIADQVGHLDVYQRTPHWIAPLPQKRYSKAWQLTLKLVPGLQRFIRRRIRKLMESTFGEATMGNEKMQQRVERRCLAHLEKQVPDPELRARLTPDYKATCKRLILCSDYYPALMKDHVDLVTQDIAGIEAQGLRTADGTLHELDVLILATGFRFNDFILPTEVYGENGQSLRAFWNELPRAHRAMCFPGFPNFFMLEGPTGVFGNTSVIDISEEQVGYVISVLNRMRDGRLAAVAPRQEAFAAYNAAMAVAIPTTTWATGGCDSWYLDKSGQPNIYPFPPETYRQDMRNPDFSEYRLMETLSAQSDDRSAVA